MKYINKQQSNGKTATVWLPVLIQTFVSSRQTAQRIEKNVSRVLNQLGWYSEASTTVLEHYRGNDNHCHSSHGTHIVKLPI